MYIVKCIQNVQYILKMCIVKSVIKITEVGCHESIKFYRSFVKKKIINFGNLFQKVLIISISYCRSRHKCEKNRQMRRNLPVYRANAVP